MNTRHFIIAAVFALALSALCSCDETEPLPAISGKAGEIEIISTKAQWESEAGNAIREVLAADFPFTPQKEPLYRLFNVPPENFNKVFKSHRNLLWFNISDTCQTARMSLRRDVWAQPQTLLTIYAPDEQSVSQFISENAKQITEVFEVAERNRVIENSMRFENKGLGQTVSALFGGSPYFPTNYTKKMQTDNFVWVSYETTFTTQGIFIYKFPYEGTSQLTPEYLIAKRNEFTEKNVPATREGSYMIANPVVTPGFFWKSYNGRRFAEIRSLWETHNDYMGGPFVSNAFLSPDEKYVIVAEGFVYAPKYDKRDLLRQLEAIIYSWHWAE